MLLAKQDNVTVAISQWLLNECVGVVERKKNEGKMDEHKASEILTGIADMIEGKIEQINLSLYPITEKVVLGSRAIIPEIHCNAADALHVYVADKSNCDYFVTADKGLAESLKKSNLRHKLTAVNILEESDTLIFMSDLKLM